MADKSSRPPLLKAIYYSIRDALAYRQLDRSPDNRDITINNYDYGNGSPRIDAALQLSTVFACVRLIAETISTLPIFLYKRIGERRVLAREHPLFTLLHDSPNADMTAVEFWEAIVSQLCLWGNAYCLKHYSGDQIVAIDPLNPALMTVRRTLDGALIYVYADPRGQREYTEDDVWHVKGFGVDGLVGLSPVGVGWRSVVAATSQEQASANLFGSEMKATALVTHKEFLKQEQYEQTKDRIERHVFGNARTGSMLFLDGDMGYQQLTINPVDAQMLESRSFSVEDICRWFNVPPSMIGHGTMVSNWGTGREQMNLGFLQYVLRAYMVRIEQGIKKSLLNATERSKYYAEYSVEGLLRADSTARAAYYAQMVQNGLKTRNEVRELENDPPIEGGDELTVQSNLIPVTLLGQITNSTAAPAGNDNELSD